ncbi:MAG: arsenate reductase ArsC [Actinobacteria bacterium]|nr:arsenate reductase ArsC [Actinomycetota bacterium]
MDLIIAFICVGNSCRSQMAEGFARYYLKDIPGKNIKIYSAGTHPAGFIMPYTLEVMEEKNIDISRQYPKTIHKIPPDPDLVFTMGCNVDCPHLPSKYRADWNLEDPVGKSLEFYRQTRDKIELSVKDLAEIIKKSATSEEVIKNLKNLQLKNMGPL